MNGASPPDRQSMIALGVLLALGLIIGRLGDGRADQGDPA